MYAQRPHKPARCPHRDDLVRALAAVMSAFVFLMFAASTARANIGPTRQTERGNQNTGEWITAVQPCSTVLE